MLHESMNWATAKRNRRMYLWGLEIGCWVEGTSVVGEAKMVVGEAEFESSAVELEEFPMSISVQ